MLNRYMIAVVKETHSAQGGKPAWGMCFLHMKQIRELWARAMLDWYRHGMTVWAHAEHDLIVDVLYLHVDVWIYVFSLCISESIV